MIDRRTLIHKCISGCIVIVPFVILFFLFSQYFALTGELRFTVDFRNESAFVDAWRPLGRAMDREKNLRTGNTAQRIVGEPVYMDVTVPRSFDTVDVTMEYKNPDHAVVEFGVVTSTEPYAVRLQPFQSTVIDEALLEWNLVTDPTTGLHLLQQEKKFDTVDAFIAKPPRDAVVATYNSTLPYTYVDAAYRPSSAQSTIDRLLRGPHQFVTYAADEDLHSTWSFVDMNREFNDDSVHIEVLFNGSRIAEQWLADDGDVTASTMASGVRQITIDVPSVAQGIYEYKISTTNDIVITQIVSDQERFVAKNSITVINNPEFSSLFPNSDTNATVLTMNGGQLRAQTDHSSGLQTITIDTEELILDEIHSPTWWEAELQDDLSTVRTVTLPMNDVTIATQGFFAFEPSAYFDPNDGITALNERITLDMLDYIFYSNYTSPEETNRTIQQHSTVSFDGVVGDRKQLTFVLSAPGLDRHHHELSIERMEFVFHREPLWKRLQKRFVSSL